MIAVWARTFRGALHQTRVARRFVAYQLEGSTWCDDAVTVTSELFANAVRHTRSGEPGGLVVVQVSRWSRGIRIAVTDQGSDRPPVIRDHDPAAHLTEGGMGLMTAAALSAQLDWHDDRSGRTVYALLGTSPHDSCGPSDPRPSKAGRVGGAGM